MQNNCKRSARSRENCPLEIVDRIERMQQKQEHNYFVATTDVENLHYLTTPYMLLHAQLSRFYLAYQYLPHSLQME